MRKIFLPFPVLFFILSAKKAEVKVLHQMNHVLKEASVNREKNLQTYYDPALPLHPELVPALLDFIKKVSKF